MSTEEREKSIFGEKSGTKWWLEIKIRLSVDECKDKMKSKVLVLGNLFLN